MRQVGHLAHFVYKEWDMPSLQKAFTWAEDTCEEPNVGYSQTYREGQVVNGIKYYDCSSFISAALTAGGFFTENPWFYTGTQTQYMKQAGWKEYVFQNGDISGFALKNGDVLIKGAARSDVPGDVPVSDGHTEMVWDAANGYTMGAHSSLLPLDDQVSKHYIDQRKNLWYFVMRYGEGVTPSSPSFTAAGLPYRNQSGISWIYKDDRDMTEADEENNAKIVYWYLCNMGWSRIAICAWIGNMNVESHLQPRAEENKNEPDDSQQSGFGLVQWTPRNVIKQEAKLIDGVDTYYNSGDLQMNAILIEYAYYNAWSNKYKGTTYPETHCSFYPGFSEFYSNTAGQWLPIYNSGSLYGWSDVPNGVGFYDAVMDTGKWTLEQHVKMWIAYYGRGAYNPLYLHLDQRLQYAEKWYKFFENHLPGGGGETTIEKHRKMPVWMMAYPF